jgi:hypothetical protein
METQDIVKLQNEIKNINEKYEKLSEYVKTIVPKHENVMSSVLDHLVHQATTLKLYSAKSQHTTSEPPNTAVLLSNKLTEEDFNSDMANNYFRNIISNATAHFKNQISQTELNLDPFPYVYVKDVFPTELYQQILDHIPENNKLKTLHELGRVTANYSEKRKAMPLDTQGVSVLNKTRSHKLWLSISDWIASPEFQDVITQKFRSFLSSRFQDQKPKLSTSSFFISDQVGYELGPHTDAAWKVITLLFYLPSDNSLSHLGTSVYKHINPDFECTGESHYNRSEFKLCKTCEFLPNTMFGFFRTSTSFHGVEPLVQHDVVRNTITVQFCVK